MDSSKPLSEQQRASFEARLREVTGQQPVRPPSAAEVPEKPATLDRTPRMERFGIAGPETAAVPESAPVERKPVSEQIAPVTEPTVIPESRAVYVRPTSAERVAAEPDGPAAARSTVRTASGERDLKTNRIARNREIIEQHKEEPEIRAPKEIHLGMSGMVVMALVLAILCGGFFLYGYNIGRNSAQTADNGTMTTSPDFGSFKPSPGSPAVQTIPGYDSNGNPTGTDPAARAANAEMNASDANATVNASDGGSTHGKVLAASAVQDQVESSGTSEATPVAAPAVVTMQPAATGGSAVIQVATMANPTDADSLVAQLRQRGYAATEKTSSRDPLIHVQVGPFNKRQDAVAIQQRLLSDGFNAVMQ